MTLSEAERQYREFMRRLDVAYAFGHGCSSLPSAEATAMPYRAIAQRG
jgi:hypothetical protein